MASTTALDAAQALVEDINMQLLPFNNSCAYLKMDTTLDARVNEAEKELYDDMNYYVPHRDLFDNTRHKTRAGHV